MGTIMNKLYALLFSLSIMPLCGMQQPIGTQNQQQSDANQNKFQNRPFFTLAVLQPATGFKSLEAYINQVQLELKAQGYGVVPPADWHLSVMIFAVPFPQGKIDPAYAQQAMNNLSSIIEKGFSPSTQQPSVDALTNIVFGFKALKSIGTHKFIVAEFERIKKPFFRVYGDIVRAFFNTYGDSWMFYGYGMVPHVSVASKMIAAGPAASTSIATKPAQPIKKFKLRHKGKAYQRKLEISGRWHDPQQQKMVEIKSLPI